ncbi:MAG: (deoxy)nucleoside triphosphate pyrophosphohydrolase [Desulfuromonadaceae bacterium]|nr:(deoxy)nucleoside triphosphate pyrophosphohydrolase [Desulfuromonadaceae bacterium]
MPPLRNTMPPLIVIAAVLHHRDTVLITQRRPACRLAGKWEFPGGKLEDDESPQDGLKREIREELGIEITVGEIFAVSYHRYDWGTALILAYTCQPLSLAIKNLEVADHRWVTPAAIDAFEMLPADEPIVRKLQHIGGD